MESAKNICKEYHKARANWNFGDVATWHTYRFWRKAYFDLQDNSNAS